MIIILSLPGTAQEREDYDLVFGKFETYYNSQDFDEIFDLFSPAMKGKLPQNVTVQTFKGLFDQMGEITQSEFSRTHRGAHIYMARFDEIQKDIRMVLNSDLLMDGLLISEHIALDTPPIERNKTKMILPFKEEWNVFWGGETISQNYHVAYENQQFAYDLMIIKDGSSYEGDPGKNESYHVFGKEIIAPCDGRIVEVITGVIDNIPGELNPAQLTGNTVVLETDNNEFILFAHLKQGSVAVKEGQMVKQGDLLGECGNSGNTTEPHLHLSLQNRPDMMKSIGGKIYFNKIMVNGEVKEDYLPLRGERIKNINETN